MEKAEKWKKLMEGEREEDGLLGDEAEEKRAGKAESLVQRARKKEKRKCIR